jgi:hypothetical protein
MLANPTLARFPKKLEKVIFMIGAGWNKKEGKPPVCRMMASFANPGEPRLQKVQYWNCSCLWPF